MADSTKDNKKLSEFAGKVNSLTKQDVPDLDKHAESWMSGKAQQFADDHPRISQAAHAIGDRFSRASEATEKWAQEKSQNQMTQDMNRAEGYLEAKLGPAISGVANRVQPTRQTDLGDLDSLVSNAIKNASVKKPVRQIPAVDTRPPYGHRPTESTPYTPGQVKPTDSGTPFTPAEQARNQASAQARAQKESQSSAAGEQKTSGGDGASWTVTTTRGKPMYVEPPKGLAGSEKRPKEAPFGEVSQRTINQAADVGEKSSALGKYTAAGRDYLTDGTAGDMPLREVIQKMARNSTLGKAAEGGKKLWDKFRGNDPNQGIIDSKRKK